MGGSLDSCGGSACRGRVVTGFSYAVAANGPPVKRRTHHSGLDSESSLQTATCSCVEMVASPVTT